MKTLLSIVLLLSLGFVSGCVMYPVPARTYYVEPVRYYEPVYYVPGPTIYVHDGYYHYR